MPHKRSVVSTTLRRHDSFVLSTEIDKALASYVLAASAAEVAVLALTPSAEANCPYALEIWRREEEVAEN